MPQPPRARGQWIKKKAGSDQKSVNDDKKSVSADMGWLEVKEVERQLEKLCGCWIDTQGSGYRLSLDGDGAMIVTTTRSSGDVITTSGLIHVEWRYDYGRIVWGRGGARVQYTISCMDHEKLVWSRSRDRPFEWTRVEGLEVDEDKLMSEHMSSVDELEPCHTSSGKLSSKAETIKKRRAELRKEYKEERRKLNEAVEAKGNWNGKPTTVVKPAVDRAQGNKNSLRDNSTVGLMWRPTLRCTSSVEQDALPLTTPCIPLEIVDDNLSKTDETRDTQASLDSISNASEKDHLASPRVASDKCRSDSDKVSSETDKATAESLPVSPKKGESDADRIGNTADKDQIDSEQCAGDALSCSKSLTGEAFQSTLCSSNGDVIKFEKSVHHCGEEQALEKQELGETHCLKSLEKENTEDTHCNTEVNIASAPRSHSLTCSSEIRQDTLGVCEVNESLLTSVRTSASSSVLASFDQTGSDPYIVQLEHYVKAFLSSPPRPQAWGQAQFPLPVDRHRITVVLESCFSDASLYYDPYLRNLMMQGDGWVPVASLQLIPHLQAFGVDSWAIKQAVLPSMLLELDGTGHYVRIRDQVRRDRWAFVATRKGFAQYAALPPGLGETPPAPVYTASLPQPHFV